MRSMVFQKPSGPCAGPLPSRPAIPLGDEGLS
jgi:hypothetical protein